VPRPLRSLLGRARLGAALLLTAALASLAVAGSDVSEDADVDRGRQLFITNCGTCHALAEAGTSAQVGPDLDAAFAQSRTDGMDNDTIEGVVQGQIANPRDIEEGVPDHDRVFMAADIVTGQDAEDVATYVATVAGIPGAAPPPLGEPQDVFTEKCGSCHALSAAGTTGTTGPDLDAALAGMSARQIEESIVDPDAIIAQGYGAGVMPQDFEQQLPPENLKALVQYLLDSVSSGGG
jgi:mono/diheme cytochrome c family protein